MQTAWDNIVMKIVAIHQPNFFPWLGYFHKLRHADCFVVLDHVQFPKTGAGTWINRVRMLIAGEGRWITASLDRNFHGTRTIREMRLAEDRTWITKSLASIRQSYMRSPHFATIFPILESALARSDEGLAEMNLHGIHDLCEYAGLSLPEMHLSSQMGALGASNELLIDLIKKVGGTHYLCGAVAASSSGYHDEDAFARAGITVVHQCFEHPVYSHPAKAGFEKGLSIVDALFYAGPAATLELLSPPPRAYAEMGAVSRAL